MKLFSKTLTAEIQSEATNTETSNATIRLPDFIKVLFTLTLIGLTIQFFQIEEGLGLFDLMKVVIPGFIIYAFLPLSFRMPFFFLLNVAALVLLFGVSNGLLILTGCLLFFGLTLLPVAWKYKAFLVVMATLILVLLRLEYFAWEGSTQVVTVIGVLIMFRSILYMYELQYEKEDPGIWKRINYFFLLPNLIFYIFPIVDYKTFVRKYYDRPAVENYSKGLKYMFTGLTHFLIYRILYFYCLPGLMEVKNSYDLLQYMCVSYAMIIRLSGLFHFSAGVICLFGFNLPETFSNYFLATNFSDLWRRINIYWKDFVMKVFYFPIYFKFKKRNNAAVFITVMIVFFFNWFLHAYQWFWIRGTFLIKENDVIFWALLGLFVAYNSVLQKNNKVKKVTTGFKFTSSLLNTSKMLGMFLLMSFLWIFWISPGIEEWWQFLIGIEPLTMQQAAFISGGIIAILLVGTGLHYLYDQYAKNKATFSALNTPPLVIVNSVLLALVIFGVPKVSEKISSLFQVDVSPLLSSQLSRGDQEQMFKGYYDELIVGNNLNTRLWEVNRRKPKGWGKLKTTDILEWHDDDLIIKTLKPNHQVEFKDELLTTNEYGLRDKYYPKSRSENTLRMALLGGSMEMGSGVKDDETYENVLERKLNDSELYDQFDEVEIINFSVSGIHIPQHLAIAERQVPPFKPDVLIYTAHSTEALRSMRRFAPLMKNPKVIRDYPYLLNLAEKAGITSDMNEMEVIAKLEPYQEELYQWGFDRIEKVCRDNGYYLIVIYIRALGESPDPSEHLELQKMVEDKGYYFIDLYDIFNGVDHNSMTIAVYDRHPNNEGHLRIANRLYEVFTTDKELQKKLFDKK